MTYALQDHKPGETIDVVVIRGGDRVTLRATLGQRAASGGTPGGEGHGGAPSAASLVIKAGTPYEHPVEGERHLTDIRQLTFGGENAEAYWSPDGKKLIFQATPRGASCDQEYVLDLETGEQHMVSTGKGRTTCGYFDYPEGKRIIFASTHAAADSCPPPPDRSHGYVWAIYNTYDIYEANPDGSGLKPLIQSPGYDAEATWCPGGGKFVFTSTRDGDLDLYVWSEGGTVKRMTNTLGYDGGAFFSPDCSEIVWRASRPQGAELQEYRELFKKGLIKPHSLEIYIMNADGTNVRQLTKNGAANFCPTFHADGNRILWSSNMNSPDPREFDLWMVDKRGGDPERITFSPGFDGFPHVSPDGKWIAWASNRADPASHETNIFIARWKD
jgi:Tol biopolymer transport system component